MELTADCRRCVGLCCRMLPFARSADFAFDKAAGETCRHLADDHGCRIHDRLLDVGMRGCVAYDCFGAGQAVTATGRIADFAVVEQVHEIAWYLTEAADRGAGVDHLLTEAERLEAGPTAAAADDLRARVAAVLRRVADEARAPYADPRLAAGHDLAGADLRDHDLAGADLRGALLLGADLRGADLTDADLLGADLRGADGAGADLSRALFVTRRQLGGMRVAPDPSGTPGRLRT